MTGEKPGSVAEERLPSPLALNFLAKHSQFVNSTNIVPRIMFPVGARALYMSPLRWSRPLLPNPFLMGTDLYSGLEEI